MDLLKINTARRYKAILCDVDGTLVHNKNSNKLSRKVQVSILKAKKKVRIGIASGRSLDRVTFLFNELELKHPCIINGGAQIVHPVSRKILWEQPINQHDLRNITQVVSKVPGKVWVVDNDKEQLYTRRLQLHKPISFFIPKIQEKRADMIIRRLSQNHTLSLNKVVAYHKGWIALHITHAGATKEHAARRLAEIMKMKSEDFIGVGDGYNDYPLFKACGFNVAVGNAVDGLKQRADYIAPSVADDGVAEVMERFVL